MTCTSGTEITQEELGNVCTSLNSDERRCSGCDSSSVSNLNSIWSDKSIDCRKTFSNILYGSSYQSSNLRRVNADFYYLTKTKAINQFGCKMDGTDTDSECKKFTDLMLNLCQDRDQARPVPGICDNFLCNSFCKNVKYSELTSSSQLLNFCGCYTLPEDSVSTNLNQNLNGAVTTVCDVTTTTNQVNAIPCFPLCHQISTVQLYQASTGCRYQCNSNICVIDDVTIEAFESKIGGVSLTQICPGCSSGQAICECIITGDDLEQSFDELGITSSFNQYCGDNSVCYMGNDVGTLSPVACSDFTSKTAVTPMSVIFPITLVVILLITFIIIIVVLYFSRGKRTTKVIAKAEDMDKQKYTGIKKSDPKHGNWSYG